MERHSISPTAVIILIAVMLGGCEQRKDATATHSSAGDTNYHSELANAEYASGNLKQADLEKFRDELAFQRATQFYLWALPSINMYGMKEASEAKFGKGYNVLPIFKDRLNAKTLITTPNPDVIYALGYLDLKDDGPIVIEAPPGLQGILDDFRQRPICSVRPIEGKQWCGDVGLGGPDRGKGAKYLILPPDFKGPVPKDDNYLVFQSKTYGVFVFWRGFFKDPKQLEEPVRVMEQTKIYPVDKKASAQPMVFPNASNVPINMLYPHDFSAFQMLDRYFQHEYADPEDFEFRGMAQALGIEKGKPFQPDEKTTTILDQGAKTAWWRT